MAQKIYFMSLDFYRKRRWPINTKHRWKIWLVTRARKNLMEPLPISYSNLQWRGYIYSMCVLLLGMCVLLLGWMGCRNPGPIFVGEACRRVRLVGQSIGIDHTTGTMWLATTCHLPYFLHCCFTSVVAINHFWGKHLRWAHMISVSRERVTWRLLLHREEVRGTGRVQGYNPVDVNVARIARTRRTRR